MDGAVNGKGAKKGSGMQQKRVSKAAEEDVLYG